jgi:hypothetical protein
MKRWLREQCPRQVREVEACVGFATATKIIAEIDVLGEEQQRECRFALATLSDELKSRLQNIVSTMHETYMQLESQTLIEG